MKKTNYYHLIVYFVIFLFLPTQIIAAEGEINLAKAKLITQAENYIYQQLSSQSPGDIKVKAMPIDKRIHVPECESPFIFNVKQEGLNQSNISVKAQCKQSNWYMFLVIQASHIQQVVVLANAVSPGTLLTKDNLRIIEVDKKRLRSSTFADIEDVSGARIKRRLPAGRPVEPNNLCFVCKGDSVTISAVSNVMRVKTSGVALEDGNMGDTITVKNSRSKKRIQAVVADTGQVQINI